MAAVAEGPQAFGSEWGIVLRRGGFWLFFGDGVDIIYGLEDCLDRIGWFIEFACNIEVMRFWFNG